jgi:DNA-directed RNA polymerase beta subunit
MASVLAPMALRPPRDRDRDGRIREGTKDEGPARLRDFGDARAIRTALYKNTLDVARSIGPIANVRHSLELHNLQFEGPEEVPLATQKEAILRGESLGRKLKGTWILRDAQTGQEIQSKRSTIATIPYLTDRGTMIKGGNEYTLAHQLRLKPGVYARRRHSGELEAHVNVLPGQGLSHRIALDPASGRFEIHTAQAKMPLLPLLRALGVGDRQLDQAWGQDLAYQNRLKGDDTTAIDKLHAKLFRGREPADGTDRRTAVAEAFRKMPLDPEVTRRTLGKPHANVSADMLLDTTRKLLAISRGEAEPDDRDHLAYMTLHGPEDLLAERLGKDKATLRQALWKASRTGDLKGIPPNLMTRSVDAAIMKSGLGQPSESINPAMLFEQQGRVSRLGEGAIPSIDAVPEESRAVQPSHFGLIDPLVTPASFKVGVDSRIASGARKGADGRLYGRFRDARTGKLGYKSAEELADATIAFPGELASGRPLVAAMEAGKIRQVDRKSVDYELPDMEAAFSPITNMVPMKSAMKGNRAVMAGRMITQALPLVDPEAPLIQAAVPGGGGMSFESQYGPQMGALRAGAAGRVEQVGEDGIVVRHDDGTTTNADLYTNFPFNRKTLFHQTPTVAAGQRVAAGDLLARSNYTDAAGTTALGKNARVAYIPTGRNYEDAIEVSRSFADRMTHEAMYQHELDLTDPSVRPGKLAHIASFPGTFDRATLEHHDDDGVIRPGTVVHKGDPLILAVRQRERNYATIHKKRDASFADATVTWDHDHPGVVTDIAKTSKGHLVTVKSHAPLEEGDKLSGRFGDKGTIAHIREDEDMPHDARGRPFEVLLNPLGVISRTNPSQVIEAALGKIAAETGRHYSVEDFQGRDLTRYAMDELARHGLSDLETVHDPATGRQIKGVLTGNRFIMKLHHTAESKAQGRAAGGGYTAEGLPAKGGPTGSKRISTMDLNALLSHGSVDLLRDAGAIRGQSSPEYWQMVMSGHNPPMPRVPHIYEKFVAQLQAAGINVVRHGTRTQLMALTDRDVNALAGDRELEHAETVDWKQGMKPVKGGLFDPAKTGGLGGTRWSHFRLAEPMPNPVMEDPIRRVLGLTGKQFRAVLSGRAPLEGATGPQALAAALGRIDLDRSIERARTEIQGNRKTARDAAVRRLGFLVSARRLGLHPRDWMLSKVPVLPPAFRPVSAMRNSGIPMVGDANILYKELHDANENLRSMSGEVNDVGDEREAVYDALRAVTGLGDPLVQKNRERDVKGILKQIFGSSPKFGTLQRKLLSSTTDLVGRGVVTPDPDLDMDQVGLPIDKAFEVYRPFLVRRLVRGGMPRLVALRAVEEQTEPARQALHAEVQERPVIVNRAPTLHRYSMMAFRPVLVSGHTLRVPPIVTKGFNMDFDGDAAQYHVPASDEAVAEAYAKMLPSRNYMSPATFKATSYLPNQEFSGGIYAASTLRDDTKRPRTFATRQDAIRAFQRGEIDVDHPVEILTDT